MEFILIHPFREGNGRVARLLADLMVTQANKKPLDYSMIDETTNLMGHKHYIEAIHSGLSREYGPICEIFKQMIKG